jgi:hypothetical protein
MKAFWTKVKAFFAKVAEFLQNENGGMSSRRFFGSALVIFSAVLAWRQDPPAIVLAFLGAGTALLGLTTADARLPVL